MNNYRLLTILFVSSVPLWATLDQTQRSERSEQCVKALPYIHRFMGVLPAVVDQLLLVTNNAHFVARGKGFTMGCSSNSVISTILHACKAASYVYGIFAVSIDQRARQWASAETGTRAIKPDYSPWACYLQGYLAAHAVTELQAVVGISRTVI